LQQSKTSEQERRDFHFNQYTCNYLVAAQPGNQRSRGSDPGQQGALRR